MSASPNPWAHVTARKRRRVPLDFGEDVPEWRCRAEQAQAELRAAIEARPAKPLWQVALAEREAGR